MCGRAHCHGGETSCCSSTCLDICAECSPTISQTSWIVRLRSARIASRTFTMFSGVVLVDGRPERSTLSTDVHRP
jgi:hypothetical protein